MVKPESTNKKDLLLFSFLDVISGRHLTSIEGVIELKKSERFSF